MAALATATESYSRADIEQVVITGLKLAFHAGQELETGHLMRAVPEVRPLSQTDPERVAAMTEWLSQHTKPASSKRQDDVPDGLNGSKRKRRVAV